MKNKNPIFPIFNTYIIPIWLLFTSPFPWLHKRKSAISTSNEGISKAATKDVIAASPATARHVMPQKALRLRNHMIFVGFWGAGCRYIYLDAYNIYICVCVAICCMYIYICVCVIPVCVCKSDINWNMRCE